MDGGNADPSGLPPPLRNALPGDIALPDEPFDSTDVYVKGHKHRRYIFVWNIGNRWIVASKVSQSSLWLNPIATYKTARVISFMGTLARLL